VVSEWTQVWAESAVWSVKAMNYEDHTSTKTKTSDYQDRAAERRRTIGSDTPRDDTATESASVHR